MEVVGSKVTESLTRDLQNIPNFYKNFQVDLRGPAKLHVAFLSISLIIGLAYGGFVTYTCWVEGSPFLIHVRNFVLALVFRAFFSLLFEAVAILGTTIDVEGSNTLQSFECLSINLVFAFWLVITIYLHATMKKNFNNEITIKYLYQFGIPGIALFFGFVWIFGMEGTYGSILWWPFTYFLPILQWITCSLRLLYLFIQLALIVDIGKSVVVKSSLDNDSLSLLRKLAIVMGVLVLYFWLQFGLSVGRPSDISLSYLYFYYFVDGIQGSIICPVFYFLNKWVKLLSSVKSEIYPQIGEINRRVTNNETNVTGNRTHSIVTIGSLMSAEENVSWEKPLPNENNDVVYSSVVQSEQLKKTLDLYKRLNLMPKNENPIVDQDKFFEFKSECLKSNKSDADLDQCTKQTRKLSFKEVNKNAFYSSKYLIVDTNKKKIPEILETRPFASSVEKKDSKTELSVDLTEKKPVN